MKALQQMKFQAEQGNGPVSHHDESGSGEAPMVDLYRMLEGNFDRQVDRMRSYFDHQDKKVERTYWEDESDKSAFSRPAA